MNIPKYMKCEGCGALGQAGDTPPKGWKLILSYTGETEEAGPLVFTVFGGEGARMQQPKILQAVFCSWRCILSCAQIEEATNG